MLHIKNIFFSYHKSNTIQAVDFKLEKGKNLAIIGESGCGKSTLLQLIYGLYDLDEGKIFWNHKEVLGPKFNLIPGMDFMKYLAQDFDLMPYISVAENVGKFLSNVNSEQKNIRVQELLILVEMSEFAHVKVKYLSGGQMQRVAIARVLALEPEVLLLDEPFSHIDNFRKNSLRRKLFAYLREKQITCLIATHDSADVLSFSDTVLVMQSGKIIDFDTPKNTFENPKSHYVASLFDDVNEIPKFYFQPHELHHEVVLLYPHQLCRCANSKLQVTIINNYFRGSHYLVEARYPEGILFFENKNDVEIGAKVSLDLKR